jgi:hypothetical protein
MRTKAFIMLPKAISRAGKWHCGALEAKGKMTKTSFPFGARNPFILGNQWHWRVDELICGSVPGRLLIAYHLAKENYLAWLTVEIVPGEHRVVACLEHHSTHGSYHIHTKCGELADFRPGCSRQRNEGIRIPAKGGYNRERGYDMGPQEAINRAYATFRVTASGGDGML